MKTAESTTNAAEKSHPGQPLPPAPLGARRDMSLLMQPDPKNRARQLPVARLGEETDSPRRGPGPRRGGSCGQASGKHVGGGILRPSQLERGSIKRKLLQRCLGGTVGHFDGAGGGGGRGVGGYSGGGGTGPPVRMDFPCGLPSISLCISTFLSFPFFFLSSSGRLRHNSREPQGFSKDRCYHCLFRVDPARLIYSAVSHTHTHILYP